MQTKRVLGMAMSVLFLMKGLPADAGPAMEALESAAAGGSLAFAASSLESSKWSSARDFEGMTAVPAAVPIASGRRIPAYPSTFRTKVPPVPSPVVVATQKKTEKDDAPPADPDATRGAALGMAIGFLIGLLFGPIGALVGALIGAVIGAVLGKMMRR